MDRYCDGDVKALEIGYRALRAGYSDAQLHLCYSAGLVLAGRSGQRGFSQPDTIAPGTGVTLAPTRGVGEPLRWIIEDEPDPRVEREELAPNDELAQQLLGLRVGDTIKLDRVGEESVEYCVKEIISKFLFAHARTLRDFQRMFPTNKAFGTVEIDPALGDGRFESLKRLARRRAEFARDIEQQYRQANLPLAVVGKLSSSSVFELWDAFVASNDGLRVAVGSEGEFHEGRAASDDRLCVVDPATIHGWVRLGLRPLLERLADRLAVVQSTRDALREWRDDRRDNLGRTTGTFGWDGEHFRLVENTPEYVEAQLEQANSALELAESLCLVPAEAEVEVEVSIRDLLSDLDPAYLDSLLASLGPKRALLTDDFGFRVVGSAAGCACTWTQVFLQCRARQIGLTNSEYREGLSALLTARYDFTMFGVDEIGDELRESGWTINDRIEQFISVMIRPTIDQKSLMVTLARLMLVGMAHAPTDADLARFHNVFASRISEAFQPARSEQLYAGAFAHFAQIGFANIKNAMLRGDLICSTNLTSVASHLDVYRQATKEELAKLETSKNRWISA